MNVKDRILKIFETTKIDFLLSKQTLALNKKIYWSKWTRVSQWNWVVEPTDRQILPNEIVIETDEDLETNRRLTNVFQNKLKELQVGYYTYYTGNKSFHIHLFVDGLENITDSQQVKKIKSEITKLITEPYYNYVDSSNFNERSLIRIEGTTHLKTKRKSILTDKYINKNFELTKELIQKTLTKKIVLNNIESSKKRYCLLIEESLKTKFPTGKRNNVLLPNAVSILSDVELKQLIKTQEMNESELNGWKKKCPRFNCFQLRKYGKELNKEHLCKLCVKQGYYEED